MCKNKVKADIERAKNAKKNDKTTTLAFTNTNPVDVSVIVTTGMKDTNKEEDNSFMGSE